jgi:enamine deaminase RidA (YjgF/YER057c/UK114 family)
MRAPLDHVSASRFFPQSPGRGGAVQRFDPGHESSSSGQVERIADVDETDVSIAFRSLIFCSDAVKAVKLGNLVFCSGASPRDPRQGNKVVEGGFKPQALQALANLKAVLEAAGRASNTA